MAGNGNLSANNSHEMQPMRWAAISGLWKFDESGAHYQGRSAESGPRSPGIAISDRTLTDGTAQIQITFSKLDSAGEVSGGLALGFQSQSSRYLMVQLGAYGRAYSLAEFVPEFGWQSIESAGSVRNLEHGRSYEMRLRLTGQEIRLSVDGVPVLEKTLVQPLSGNQLGLFAWGEAPIHFGEMKVRSTMPRVFVAMQFGEPFDTLYKEVIKPRSDQLKLDVIRIDEMPGPGIIFEEIKRQIAEAKIVIAEITAPNQNVFYKLGYAHALNKPTILLAQRGKELPFDIPSYRVIFYDDSIGGKPALERNLQKHLEAILHES